MAKSAASFSLRPASADILFLVTLLLVATVTVLPGKAQKLDSGGQQHPTLKAILLQRQEYEHGKVFYSDIYATHDPKLKTKRLSDGGISPRWSWNEQKVAFLLSPYYRGGFLRDNQLRVSNADGSNGKTLTKAPYGIFAFAWSSVRDEIVYVENPFSNGLAPVVRISADGSDRQEITKPLAMGSGPPFWGQGENLNGQTALNWSPDGEKIAFTSCAEGHPAVTVIGRTGEGPRLVAKGFGPLWSPDGTKLVFRYESSTGQAPGLWIINADGSEPHEILRGELGEFGLTWAPGAKSIAFGSERDRKHQSEIFQINLDGSGLKKVASLSGFMLANPSFSSDGMKMIVNSIDLNALGVWLLDLPSHKLRHIAKGNYGSVVWEDTSTVKPNDGR
jgi:Tol biopolymer transport system component